MVPFYSPKTYLEPCGSPNEKPYIHDQKMTCPLDCRMIDIRKPEFEVQKDGEVKLKGYLEIAVSI